jgi:hypothetical protein
VSSDAEAVAEEVPRYGEADPNARAGDEGDALTLGHARL